MRKASHIRSNSCSATSLAIFDFMELPFWMLEQQGVFGRVLLEPRLLADAVTLVGGRFEPAGHVGHYPDGDAFAVGPGGHLHVGPVDDRILQRHLDLGCIPGKHAGAGMVDPASM